MATLDELKEAAEETQQAASEKPELKLDPRKSARILQRTIHDLMDTDYNEDKCLPYVGLILQCVHIQFNTEIPTAGVSFDLGSKKYIMYVNPYFFDQLTPDQRVAVMKHEVMHLTHKHVTIGFKYELEDRQLLNVAMDLVINQYIQDLPDGAMFIKNFKTVEDKPFPENKYFEYYFDELKKIAKNSKESNSEDGEDGKGGESQLTDSNGNKVQTLDSHDWGDANEDESEALKAANDLFKRAKQKATMSYSSCPKELDDIISEFSKAITAINHKKEIERAYKKTQPNSERQHSWKRPSKRHGAYAKGTKNGTSPYVTTYVDTSGSISIEEFNEFLTNNDKFVKFTNKKCTLSMFHTDVYHTEKYKMGRQIHLGDAIKSGGTDLAPVLKDIKKKKPDMAIIFTDGYYSDVKIQGKMPPILFIISEGGNVNHPLRRYGRTVKIKP